jgi:hypothetical protein
MISLNLAQTSVSAAGGQILFNTIVQNTFGVWDGSFLRIQVPRTGYVEVSVCLTIGSSSSYDLMPYVVKNNLTVQTGTMIFDQSFTSGVNLARIGQTIIQCNAGDSLQILAYYPVNLFAGNGGYVYYKML